ncbi:hypothetical protein [Phenylobacterium aquaticum]|uniref:hypothetical protein n=1 Tax=Phenylobacterium aquaticum TaxID=1763816 RepID=UPI001F5C338A|nr:hypothetical protein [Phenylobacterium aquaticum]MCI3130879.1 hypothetical protein [Phenylobacterium aquaticum]
MIYDVGFARRVARWRDHLAALGDPIEPVSPPPGVWKAIEAAVGDQRGVRPRRPRRVLGGLVLAGSGRLLAHAIRRRRPRGSDGH